VERLEATDGLEGTRTLPEASVAAIISDIPYGIGAADWDVLHDNQNSAYCGSSPAQTLAGSVFRSRGKPINGWSSADRDIATEYQTWCSTWAEHWFRVLKPGGSALVFAGRRFAHRAVAALEDAGFNLKDQLAWVKPNAPFRAQRVSVVFDRRGDDESAKAWADWRLGNLRPTYEPIIWCVKPYPIGSTIVDNVLSHGVGAFNPSALDGLCSDSSNVLRCGLTREESGLHSTQKPLELMRGLVGLVTSEGDTVLDPFAGSGTTLAAAKSLGRGYIGFEIDHSFARIAAQRLASVSTGDSQWPTLPIQL
jgi:site-specific DNA-methyltransferase (adenine-specific)